MQLGTGVEDQDGVWSVAQGTLMAGSSVTGLCNGSTTGLSKGSALRYRLLPPLLLPQSLLQKSQL